MDLSKQLARAVSRWSTRDPQRIGGLRRGHIVRQTIVSALGNQLTIECCSDPILMRDGKNVKLPPCLVGEHKVTFDLWLSHLHVAVDYQPPRVPDEADVKQAYCRDHGVTYVRLAETIALPELEAACDELRAVLARRRFALGIAAADTPPVARVPSQPPRLVGRSLSSQRAPVRRDTWSPGTKDYPDE
jgi:hypothetical protein